MKYAGAAQSHLTAPPPGLQNRFRFIDWLGRLDALLGLAVHCLLIIVLPVAWILTTYALVSDSRGAHDYLIAAGVSVALFGLVVLEYFTLHTYHHILTTGWRPTSVAIAFAQMKGHPLLRQMKGIWWLLQLMIVIVVLGFWMSLFHVAPSNHDGFDTQFLWLMVQFFRICAAVGAVYACNTLLLCTVACFTASQRIVIAVWRVRFLIDAAASAALWIVPTVVRS